MRAIVHIPKRGILRYPLIFVIFIFNTIKFFIKIIEKIIFTFFDKFIFYKGHLKPINIKSAKKNILILGNSPDIDHAFIKKQKNMDILTVNYFFGSELSKLIKPNYHMIIHRPYENHVFNKAKIKMFKKYVSSNFNTIFFLTKEWKKIFGNQNNVYYLNQTISQITNYSVEKLKQFKVFPAISNVMISACYICLKMKYKNIYIHGYNLNFPIYAKVPHHYDQNIKKKIFENFDTDAYKLIDLTLSEWIHIKKLSRSTNNNIYSTKNTFLPIFKENNVK